MSRVCPSSWIALFLAGCGFETGGVATGTASVGSADETAGGTASGEGDEGDESPGDGDATSASTTMTSTTDPTGDPTTEPGEATTDPVDPSQGDSGSTDAGETTTATTATTEGEATTDPSDSGVTPGSYPNCSAPNTCADGTEDCLEVTYMKAVVGHLCVPPCDQDSDCPVPESGNATPYCPEEFGIYYCRLSCDGGLTCPDGMDCVNTTIGYRCFYPV